MGGFVQLIATATSLLGLLAKLFWAVQLNPRCLTSGTLATGTKSDMGGEGGGQDKSFNFLQVLLGASMLNLSRCTICFFFFLSDLCSAEQPEFWLLMVTGVS